MDLELTDRVAIVTGGTAGIGAGISEVLATEGAQVIALYRSHAEESEAFAAGLRERGGRCWAVRCDVTDAQALPGLFARIKADFGQPTILVNNAAGGFVFKPFDELTLAEWNNSMDGLLTHIFTMSSLFIRSCKRAGTPGHIVNLSSKAAIQQNGKDKAAYAAAKGAIISLTRAIAKEATEYGIICNSVLPGYVTTKYYNPGDPAYEDRRKYLPTGRFGTPIEMGRIVAFLCSPASSQIIGADIDATGGTLI